MGRLEYYGLSCSFCGFQSARGVGLFSPSDQEKTIYRCPDCGSVLCSDCVEKEHHFTVLGSTTKLALGVATMGFSLPFTGIRKEDKKCLKCGSKRIKKISK